MHQVVDSIKYSQNYRNEGGEELSADRDQVAVFRDGNYLGCEHDQSDGRVSRGAKAAVISGGKVGILLPSSAAVVALPPSWILCVCFAVLWCSSLSSWARLAALSAAVICDSKRVVEWAAILDCKCWRWLMPYLRVSILRCMVAKL